MMFLFLSENNALLRTRIRPPWQARRPSFPLLAEMWLSDKDMAEVSVRVPASSVFFDIAITVTLAYYLADGAISVFAFLMVLAIGSVFGIFGFLIEKNRLLYGLGEIQAYLGKLTN